MYILSLLQSSFMFCFLNLLFSQYNMTEKMIDIDIGILSCHVNISDNVPFSKVFVTMEFKVRPSTYWLKTLR